MALNGRLEELNLLDILQIVAFAKKTGTLRVEGTTASGAVLFRDGVVLCALSSSTTPILSPMAGRTLDESRALLLEDEVRIALRELVALREGRFEFVLSNEPPTHFEGMDVRKFLLTDGVDPQALMLELARELDNERKDSSSLLESPDGLDSPLAPEDEPVPSPPALTSRGVSVVLADDEPQVLEAVRAELEDAGCSVAAALGAQEAIELVGKLVQSRQAMVLVTDLAMPSSNGDSFEGGFEIIEHLKELNPQIPAMVMTESLSPEARERARTLGVRKVAFKPALTKLDAAEYTADLRSLANVVRREIASLMVVAKHVDPTPPVPELNHDVMFNFLQTMTEQLTRPTNGIARMILRVGSKYCERVVLFLVKGPRAKGLAAIHRGQPTKLATETAREMVFDVQHVRPFAEVVYSHALTAQSHETSPLPLFNAGSATEYVLLPLLHNREVLSILLCDNPNSGRPLGNLSGLALFLTQAGMAMENASLHQKLRSFETQFSVDNQGPLTQELTPIVPTTD
jgi:CheY-like chemotaxis protein